MSHWPFVGALAAALTLVSWETSAVPRTATGTVTGKVTLTARSTPPLATSAYGRRDVGPRAADVVPETRNVVIYVAGTKPSAPPPPMRARIVQRDEQFRPQVTVVTTGSTVDFPNEDPFFHNVFSLSRAATFDLGRYRSGTSKSEIFRKPGVVKVFCHLHSQMTAMILVLDHGWFTIARDDGTFTISDVPAGERTIVAWHERIGERRETVRLTPGGVTPLSFTLPVLDSSR